METQSALNIKRKLHYWVPGYTLEQMQQLCPATEGAFSEEEFFANIQVGKFQVQIQDDKRFSETEKAFHYAFNPEKRVRSDYECMLIGGDIQVEDQKEPLIQKCENPGCTGTETKWIECNVDKCWYHLSCAGIPSNKTAEEIEQMDWTCKKCKQNKLQKRK